MINVFKERFRRLFSTGIVCLVAMMSLAVFCLCILNSDYRILRDRIEIYHFIPFFIASLVVMAGLVECGVDFVADRKKSDVFHSLPASRNHMYYGTLLAVLSWVAIDVFLPVIIVSIAVISIGANASTIVQIDILWIIAGVYVTAVSFFSIANCGNLIKAAFLTLGIIFLPRCAIMIGEYYYNLAFYSQIRTLPAGIFSDDYNAIINVYTRLSSGCIDNWKQFVISAGGTALLSSAFIIIGARCFAKRKSEIAGSMEISKPVRVIFSVVMYIVPVVFISWLPAMLMFVKSYAPIEGVLFMIPVFIALFLFVELTYSKKKLLQSAIAVVVSIIVLTAANCLGISYGRTRELDRDKTKYIEFVDSDFNDTSKDYVLSKMTGRIDDKEILDILFREGGLYKDKYGFDRSITLKINNGGISFYRTVECGAFGLRDIFKIYFSNHILKLPEDGYIDSGWGDYSDDLYETLKAELEDKNLIDYIEFMRYYDEPLYETPVENWHSLTVCTTINGKEKQIYLIVDKTLPKTFELLDN